MKPRNNLLSRLDEHIAEQTFWKLSFAFYEVDNGLFPCTPNCPVTPPIYRTLVGAEGARCVQDLRDGHPRSAVVRCARPSGSIAHYGGTVGSGGGDTVVIKYWFCSSDSETQLVMACKSSLMIGLKCSSNWWNSACLFSFKISLAKLQLHQFYMLILAINTLIRGRWLSYNLQFCCCW